MPWTSCGRRRLLLQLHSLDGSISGGLLGYVRRAAALLKDSQEGRNPLEGFTPSVPSGHQLQLGSPEFLEHEATGAALPPTPALTPAPILTLTPSLTRRPAPPPFAALSWWRAGWASG
jgi:hypothetical protein